MAQATAQKSERHIFQKLRAFFTKKRVIAMIIIIALLAGIKWGGSLFFGGSAEAMVNTAMAVKGDITVSISGTGTIAPIEQYNVVPLVKGDILADYLTEGDKVEKDTLLYEIDTKEVKNSIEKAILSLERSQYSHDQNVDAVKNMYVTSGLSGLITNVYVKEGDNIQNNAKIADVVDDRSMVLKVTFHSEDLNGVSVGDMATVTLASSFVRLQGTITRIASGERVMDGYMLVRDVEISILNPGLLSDTDMASATINGADCSAPSRLTYANSTTITAKTSGEVEQLYFHAGDLISAGDTILRLYNDTASLNQNTSALNVQDAALALQNLYDQEEDYNITSPIAGTVIQKNYKAGDTIGNASTSVVMAIIADMSQFVFTIDVDELDISKIKVGQEVEITADALPGETFMGVVDNISVVGSSQSGVATYPVKIVLDARDGLLPGMNVSAEIVVDESRDTLMVPINAVNRGNIVYVKDDGTYSQAAAQEEGTVPQVAGNGEFTTGEGESVAFDRSAMGGAERNTAGNADRATMGGEDSTARGEERTLTVSPGGTAGEGETRSGSVRVGNNGQVANIMLEMAQQNAPAGFVAVVVETGVNDDNFIEILSGLKEGDTVVVTAPTGGDSNNVFVMSGGGMSTGGTVVVSGAGPSGGGAMREVRR